MAWSDLDARALRLAEQGAHDDVREWFSADGFDTRRLARLRDPETKRRLAVLMSKRWEKRNPERAKTLHAKAAAAWKARDPAAWKASLARRKRRYRQRHAERVQAANRRSYLRWRAVPGNLEAARKRAAARRQEANHA